MIFISASDYPVKDNDLSFSLPPFPSPFPFSIVASPERGLLTFCSKRGFSLISPKSRRFKLLENHQLVQPGKSPTSGTTIAFS
jgi:hypothetical protein